MKTSLYDDSFNILKGFVIINAIGDIGYILCSPTAMDFEITCKDNIIIANNCFLFLG